MKFGNSGDVTGKNEAKRLRHGKTQSILQL